MIGVGTTYDEYLKMGLSPQTAKSMLEYYGNLNDPSYLAAMTASNQAQMTADQAPQAAHILDLQKQAQDQQAQVAAAQAQQDAANKLRADNIAKYGQADAPTVSGPMYSTSLGKLSDPVAAGAVATLNPNWVPGSTTQSQFLWNVPNPNDPQHGMVPLYDQNQWNAYAGKEFANNTVDALKSQAGLSNAGVDDSMGYQDLSSLGLGTVGFMGSDYASANAAFEQGKMLTMAAMSAMAGGLGSELTGSMGITTGNSFIDNALMSAGKALITGGDPLKAGLTSGITGGLTDAIPDTGNAFIDRAINSAVGGGVGAAVNGGNVGTGALLGGVTGAVNSAGASALNAAGGVWNDLTNGTSSPINAGTTNDAYAGFFDSGAPASASPINAGTSNDAYAGFFSGTPTGGFGPAPTNDITNLGNNSGSTTGTGSPSMYDEAGNLITDGSSGGISYSNYGYLDGGAPSTYDPSAPVSPTMPDTGTGNTWATNASNDPNNVGNAAGGYTGLGGSTAALTAMYSSLGFTPAQIAGLLGGGTGTGTGAGQTGTALSRLLGISPDLSSVGGSAISGLLGYLGADKYTNMMQQNADWAKGIGQPARDKYNAATSPGFDISSIPGLKSAMDLQTQIYGNKLSATHGNVSGWGGSQPETNAFVLNSTAMPAYQNYLNSLSGAGFGTSGAAVTAGGDAATSTGAPYASLGQSTAQLFNPTTSLKSLLGATL